MWSVRRGRELHQRSGPDGEWNAALSPEIGSNGWYANIGNSSYHALQTTLRHVSGPLELMAAYTYSKSMDLASGLGSR